MRAVQLVEPGRVELVEVPTPAPGDGEVVLQVTGAGLCGSDLHLLHLPERLPLQWTLGHETVGRVAAIGTGVDGWADGDAALVHLIWSCGVCRPCREGRDNVCAAAGRHATPPCPGIGPDGGMADFIKVPAQFLEPLGALDPVASAPFVDAGLTPMHAINGARHWLTPGATAAVIGVGGLGHMGVQLLAATAQDVRIVAVDTDPAKLDHAKALGASVTVAAGEQAASELLELTGGVGIDAVFDFVGSAATVGLATRVVAAGGALRLVGLGGGSVEYAASLTGDPLPWGVDVRRSYAGTRGDLRQVLQLARAGAVAVDVTRYALADAVQAFADLDAGRVRARAVIVP
jgi:alcohol dehydrogenase, propanol-preferring